VHSGADVNRFSGDVNKVGSQSDAGIAIMSKILSSSCPEARGCSFKHTKRPLLVRQLLLAITLDGFRMVRKVLPNVVGMSLLPISHSALL
jgi:hypothetical protein